MYLFGRNISNSDYSKSVFPKKHILQIHKRERIQATLAAQFPILSLFSFAVLIIFVNFASVT